MSLLSIDPGPEQSAWLILRDGLPYRWEKEPNRTVIHAIRDHQFDECDHMAIEMIQSFGMAVGAEVFETVFWIGQFVEAWHPSEHTRVFRKDVKMHLCQSMRAKDANIRQALIDKFGGESALGNGGKCPMCKGRRMVGRGKDRQECAGCGGSGRLDEEGPLFGISGDCWSALAVAVTFSERQSIEISEPHP